MTAKSRVRKTKKKIRRVNDVNSKPSKPAEDAQDSGRSRATAGSGYVIEVGGHSLKGLPVDLDVIQSVTIGHPEEDILIPLHRVDFQSISGGGTFYVNDSEREVLEGAGWGKWDGFPGEEDLRAQTASDSEGFVDGGLAGASRTSGSSAEGNAALLKSIVNAQETASRHLVFFEAETNGQPTHIASEDCNCGQTAHHWKELGEN